MDTTRTEMLLGKEATEKLNRAAVAVFGLGGVGGYALEALVRAGIGRFVLVDSDTFAPSNLNRQILATEASIGRLKTEVAEERIHSINPNAEVQTHAIFFLPENADGFDFSKYDYVIDAIDTVSAKMELVRRCQRAGTPIISSMGTGNKLDPTRFEVSDIYKTSVCPLAKAMRTLCRKEGLAPFKVVYSKEEAITPMQAENGETKKPAVGSCSFVPSVAGLILAGEVIKDIIK